MARKAKTNTLPWHLGALFTVAVWGMTFISSKQLLNEGFTPAWIFTIRFAIAYLGMWLIGIVPKYRQTGACRLWTESWKDELLLLLLGVTGGSVYFVFENSSLMYTQACNSSFIVCTAPLHTTLLTLLVLKTAKGRQIKGLQNVRMTKYLAGGTLLALTGMALVIFSGYQLHLSPKGDLLALGAALLWAVYSILMSSMTEKYGTAMATRKIFFYGLLTIVPFLFADGIPFEAATFTKPIVWGNLIFLGVVASLICYVLWNAVMFELGNVTATNYIYLNPVFTLIFAMIFLDESLTPISGLGSALILAGVILAGKRAEAA